MNMSTTYRLMAAMIVMDKEKIKETRTALEGLNFYDDSRKIVRLNDHSEISVEKFALPINDHCSSKFLSLQETDMLLPPPFQKCIIATHLLPPSKRSLALQGDSHTQLNSSIEELLTELSCEKNIEEMMKYVPNSWERHGDLVVFPPNSFSTPSWRSFLNSLPETQSRCFWSTVSISLKCKRLGLDTKVTDDDFRSSGVTLLLGEDGWVEHIDNGIKYVFDVTKCMFSSGNITEKIRVANFNCLGEIVVDLYAGIGYFVLPYLVHAKAELVHACEWNPHAMEGLKRSLKMNRVEGKCVLHFGDNRKVKLKNVADRVNVGLIPSSEGGWALACTALKVSTGGWLHIHGNVSTHSVTESCSSQYAQELHEKYSHLFISKKRLNSTPVMKWIDNVSMRIFNLLEEIHPLVTFNQIWKVKAKHLQHVKMYAPHIHHLVLDVDCRPISI